MNAIVKGFFSIVVIKIFVFSVVATAAAITDLRGDDSWLSARKIEGRLTTSMLYDGVTYYEISAVSDYDGGGDTCSNTAPQISIVNRPNQVIELMNAMPIADIRFTIDGYDSNGLVKSWVYLARKSIEDRVAQSNYHRDYSEKDFSGAKSTMIDGLLGYYDRKYTVEAYQVEYNLLNSTDVKFLTAASLAELSTLLDKLAAGSYELDVKVVQDNGRISNHLVSLNKTQDDVVVVNATLQIVWQAPSVREDGSALVGSDIAGYEIYYTSIAPDNTTVDQFIEVGSADKTSYIMEQVPAGEYHFAIATVDTTGVKSSISDVVTTVVN